MYGLRIVHGWLPLAALPIALLIAYSRIYTGSHWPLDILAGILLGIGGGWIATRLVQWLWRRFAGKFFPSLAASHPELIP